VLRTVRYDNSSQDPSVTPRSITFQASDGTNLYYGWSLWTVDLNTTTVTIAEWAYNTTPDAPIKVGQTSEAAVPEPSTLSLALLGMGAGGVRAWRKRKAAQALAA
jgi:hypothetical protein